MDTQNLFKLRLNIKKPNLNNYFGFRYAQYY
jgi:hypothetical protein